MKTLYIVRHAKSSWAEADQRDFDRGLNDRGKRDAPRMGKRLSEKDIHPELLLTSPAKRAWSTAKRIADILKYPKERIQTDLQLYHADEDTLLFTVQKIDNKHNVVMLFGHNPGLTDFVNSIADTEVYIDNVPTCGVVVFNFHIDAWKDIKWKGGKLQFFDYPKALDD